MKKLIIWFKIEESGQGMVEYSLIFALVIILVIGALIVLGTKTLNLYQESLAIIP